jgi:hypothetical protein
MIRSPAGARTIVALVLKTRVNRRRCTTMPTRSSLAARCGATLLLAMFAAACSSGAASTPAGAQGPTLAAGTSAAPAGQGQSQQGGAGSVDDGLGHPVNVCALLPVATVASITGGLFSVAKEDDTLLSSKIYSCDYTNAAGSSDLSVTVEAMVAASAYDADLSATNQVVSAKLISGLGDKAFSGPLGQEALFGNVLIKVSNLPSDAAAETLIRTLQPKL